MILAGVDISTVQLDVALVPLDDTATSGPPAVTFRSALLEQGDRAERIRSVREAVRVLLADVGEYPVASVWVEEPFGRYRNAVNALLPIMGSVIASVPPHATVAMIAVQEWRRALGLPGNLTKPLAIAYADAWVIRHVDPGDRVPFTEHHAEALLIALAGRTLCWTASAA